MKMFKHLRVALFITATFTAVLLLAGCATAGGDKDEATPVQISNERELLIFATTAYNVPNTCAILMNNITLTKVWTPIGENPGQPVVKYLGTFDGQGHTISLLNITTTTSFAGLFAINGGTIRNLTVAGTITVSPAQDVDYIGGVVGYNDVTGFITQVISKVNITTDSNLTHNIGGIAGFNGWDQYNGDSPHYNQPYEPGGYIFQCRNEGNVTGGFNKIGGVVGENAYMVVECVNTGTITCTKTQSGWPGVGGIVGRNGNNNAATENARIQDCYNWGNVVDSTSASSSQNAYGGITGWCDSISDVRNCYTVGTLTPLTGTKNPIIGMADSPTTGRGVNNYALDSIYASSRDPVLTGTPETQAFMQSQGLVTGLNISGNAPFVLQTPGGYPILIWEN
jgi:hypothetical protein